MDSVRIIPTRDGRGQWVTRCCLREHCVHTCPGSELLGKGTVVYDSAFFVARQAPAVA